MTTGEELLSLDDFMLLGPVSLNWTRRRLVGFIGSECKAQADIDGLLGVLPTKTQRSAGNTVR